MAGRAMHLVLDQNFPWHVLPIEWPPTIRITPLRVLEPTLIEDYEDWQVMLRLHRRGDVDGFVTNDAKILSQAAEMVALSRTNLLLIVTDGVGHEPIRATGLAMVHLQEIAKTRERRPHIYLLRPRQLSPTTRPGSQINKIAEQERIPPPELIRREMAKIDRFLSADRA